MTQDELAEVMCIPKKTKDRKSVVTVLVVADNYCDEYVPLTLGDNTVFNLNYTYGILKAWNGRTLRIHNEEIEQGITDF